MGACSLFEDGKRVEVDKSRGTGTSGSALRLIDTTTTKNNHTSDSHTPPPSQQSPVQVQAHDDDTRQARSTMTMMTQTMASGNRTTAATAARCSFGMVSVALFALLAALALASSSVQASTSSRHQPSCVQITDTALFSSCASGGKVASFAFTMEGTATVATYNTVSKKSRHATV